MLTIEKALIYTFLIGLVTFSTRVFPFIVFKNKKESETLVFIEKYIPPAIMLILLFYCLKDINFTENSYGLYQLICIGLAIFFQVKFKNPLISIFGATIIYMFLIRI